MDATAVPDTDPRLWTEEQVVDRIRELKAHFGQNLCILAHHYQRDANVAVADHVGAGSAVARIEDGRIVAVAADNSLFLKPTDAGRALLPNVVEAQPWPEAKSWFVLDEYLDDTELLQRLLRATADALPAPTAKPAKKPRKPGRAKS